MLKTCRRGHFLTEENIYMDPTTHYKHCRICRALRKGNRGRKTLAERFWPNVARASPNECWLWHGCTNRAGYGIMCSVYTEETIASRISWELHNGPIPDGKCILHNCPGQDNPLCVNPKHLWCGTRKQNVVDAVAKGQIKTNHEKTHCKHGHEFTLENRYAWHYHERSDEKESFVCKTCLTNARKKLNEKRKAARKAANQARLNATEVDIARGYVEGKNP